MFLDEELKNIIDNFETSGEVFVSGARNTIKLFDYKGQRINVKSFKVPSLYNKIVYKYFRKTKARRSFEYAKLLESKEIGTPKAIAFFENFSWLGLEQSYYISEHLKYDLTFRDLIHEPDYPDSETILKQFVAFTYKLHKNGIEFLDHSPGNTLICKESDSDYAFYLVDLNRMKFHDSMDLQVRMKNLSRITPGKEMIRNMSKEYALLSGEDEQLIFDTWWGYTEAFQQKADRKKRIKKTLKFWN